MHPTVPVAQISDINRYRNRQPTATTPPTAAFRTVTRAALQDPQIAAALQHNLSSSAINAATNQTTSAVINRNTSHADSHAHPSPHVMIDRAQQLQIDGDGQATLPRPRSTTDPWEEICLMMHPMSSPYKFIEKL